MSNVVYTAIFEDRDIPRPHARDNSRYLLYTDKSEDETREVIDCKRLFASPRMDSRMYKILPHKFFSADFSLWLDANIELNISVLGLMDKYLKDNDIAFLRHPHHDCVYGHNESCIQNGLGFAKVLREQMKHYKERGLPEHNGCVSGGLILRRHSEKMERFNDLWWSEYCRYPDRDQGALMYALWKSDLKVVVIPEDYTHTPLLNYHPHG